MSDQMTHPSPDELSAFNLGQLPPETASRVEDHISECEPCCETLLGLASNDTFVALLKEAHQPVDESEYATFVTENATRRKSDQPTVPETLTEHTRYEIVRLIGKGGMGDVFEARHRMMDRTVAIKVINHEFIRKPQAVDRFHREVKAAARLSHPNIVTAFDAEQAGDLHFLVMEYVDGIDLARLVKEKGALTPREACDFARQAAIGLQHAHEQGMVHRDIKPHNLMVSTDGTVKILDFGLASLAPGILIDEETTETRGELTAAGSIVGTPDFISPEQAKDAHQADIRSDIYSLGATLYYLLSGRAPFADASVIEKLKSHAEQEPVPLENLQIEIPDGLAEVIRKMLAKDPAKRYQSPQEVADALVPFVDLHRSEPAQPSLETQVSRSRRGLKWLTMMALAFCTMIAAGIVFYVKTDYGTIRVELNDPDTTIKIDDDMSVNFQNVDESVLGIRAGEHKLHITQGDMEFETETFRIRRNDVLVLTVELIDDSLQAELQRPGELRNKRIIGRSRPSRRPRETLEVFTQVGRFDQHEGHVYDAIVSPDGKYAVSCGADKMIRVWDLETREVIRVLEGHDGAIAGLAVSMTGRLLASGDNSGVIRLWNLRTGEQLGKLTGHEGFVGALAFLPDGHLLSAASDKSLRIWDVNAQKLLRTIDLGANVEKMAPLWDSRHVMLSGAHTGGWGVVNYDLEKGEKIDPQPSAESCLAVASDRRTTLIGTVTGMLRVYDKETGKLIVQMAHPRAKAARDAAFLPDGRHAITTTRDGGMRLWNLEDGKLISSMSSDSIGRVSLSPDGRYALTIGSEKGVTVWRLPDSVLPNPIRSEPAAAPETRRQFEGLIAAARAAETGDDWKAALAVHAPILFLLSEQDFFAADTGRDLVQMLADLPDAMHQQLLQEGYLKWKATELDERRQHLMREVLRAYSNQNSQKVDDKGLQALFEVTDTGFVVLDLPESETQAVAWYARYDNFPIPLIMLLSGGTASAVQETLLPEVRQPVEDLKNRLYTDLPPVPVASSEIRAALLALRENFPTGDISDKLWKSFVSEHTPFLAADEAPGKTGRVLVTLLHGLPQDSVEKLLKQGYMKWKFTGLDRVRQEQLRDMMQDFLSNLPEQVSNEKVLDLMMNSLIASDVGFVVLNRPELEEQFLAFFLQTPLSSKPTIFPVLGDTRGDFRELNSPEIQQQIKDVLKQPDSAIPQAPLDVPAPAVASSETREHFEALVAAVSAAETDEDWQQLISEHTPVFEEFPEKAARDLLGLVSGIPQQVQQELLQAGYLKWRFRNLDETRADAMKSVFGEILSMAPQPGIDKNSIDDLKSILDRSDTGFAVLTLPETPAQIVIWYAQPPESPVPIMVPILGVHEETESKVFKRSVYKQLSELEDKPYSTLPPDEKLISEDLQRLQGVWLLVSCHVNGEPITPRTHTLEIVENLWLPKDPKSGRTMQRMSFEIDPTQNPKHINILSGDPPEQIQGIYKIENDELHITKEVQLGVGRPRQFDERGERISIMIMRRKPTTQKEMEIPIPENDLSINHALQFNGDNSAVSLPIRYDGSYPITLECTVLLEDHGERGRMLISDTHDAGINLQISPTDQKLLFSPRSERQAQPIAYSREKFPFGKKVHVAGVYTGQEVRLYLNGKLQETVQVPDDFRFEPSPMKLAVGANPDGPASFRQSPIGLIDEVRISKVARYDENFTPAERFEPDEDTLALYHFDEGEGAIARDSSGNKLDAEIFDAKWVKWFQDKPEAVPESDQSTNHALQFDAEYSGVSLPVPFDGSHSLTLECTLRLEQSDFDRTQLLKTNMFRGPFSLNLVWTREMHLEFWWHTGGPSEPMVRSKQPFPLGEIVHIAAVYTGKEIRLFVNGELQDSQPMPPNYRFPRTTRSINSITIGSLPSGDPPIEFGKSVLGLVDEIRISKVARYDKDYTPVERFETDENTMALYHFDDDSRNIVRDSSGNQRDGKNFGAKWVEWPKE